MKKNKTLSKSYLTMLIALLTLSGCDLFKEDQYFIVDNQPEVSIFFEVPTAALPITPTGTQGTLDLTTPNSNLISGRFPANGTTDINVNVSSDNVSKITVSAYRAGGTPVVIQREQKADISLSNRTVKIALPLSTLNFGNTPVPAAGTVLEIVATTTSGKTVTRLFTVNRI